RSQLEQVADQQLRVVAVISLERRRCGTGENIMVRLELEQAGRHGRAGIDQSRVENPMAGPIGLQPAGSRKFGAVAYWSWEGDPIAWHFKQGAPGLVNSALAMAISCSVSGSCFTGM